MFIIFFPVFGATAVPLHYMFISVSKNEVQVILAEQVSILSHLLPFVPVCDRADVLGGTGSYSYSL